MAEVPTNRREAILSGINSGSGGMPDMNQMIGGLPEGTQVEGSRETTQTPMPGAGGGAPDITALIHELGVQRKEIDSSIERTVIASRADADRAHNESRLAQNTMDAEAAIKEAYAGMRSAAGGEIIGINQPNGPSLQDQITMQEQMQLLSVKLQAAGFAPATGQSGAYEQYGYKPTEVAQQMFNTDRENPITRA